MKDCYAHALYSTENVKTKCASVFNITKLETIQLSNIDRLYSVTYEPNFFIIIWTNFRLHKAN
jgi:hypothetical protein